MGRYELASDEMYRIERQLESASSEPEALLIKASAILAELTGCAGISTTPKDEYTVIKKVELVPIGKKTIMVVLATSSGLLKSKVCRMDVPITLDLIELFYNVAAANFIGVRVSDIHAPLLQNIAASLGEKASICWVLLTQYGQLRAAQARSCAGAAKPKPRSLRRTPWSFDLP